MTERRPDDLPIIPPNGRIDLSQAPESAGDETFTLRGGLRFLIVIALVMLLLSVVCWLVGGPQNQ